MPQTNAREEARPASIVPAFRRTRPLLEVLLRGQLNFECDGAVWRLARPCASRIRPAAVTVCLTERHRTTSIGKEHISGCNRHRAKSTSSVACKSGIRCPQCQSGGHETPRVPSVEVIRLAGRMRRSNILDSRNAYLSLFHFAGRCRCL
jgi:hypothetical protein